MRENVSAHPLFITYSLQEVSSDITNPPTEVRLSTSSIPVLLNSALLGKGYLKCFAEDKFGDTCVRGSVMAAHSASKNLQLFSSFASFSVSSCLGPDTPLDTPGTTTPMASVRAFFATSTWSSTISSGSIWVSVLIELSSGRFEAERSSRADQNRTSPFLTRQHRTS